MDMDDKGHASQVYSAAQETPMITVPKKFFFVILGGFAICLCFTIAFVPAFFNASDQQRTTFAALQGCQERAEAAKDSCDENARRLEREVFDLDEQLETCHQAVVNLGGAL